MARGLEGGRPVGRAQVPPREFLDDAWDNLPLRGSTTCGWSAGRRRFLPTAGLPRGSNWSAGNRACGRRSRSPTWRTSHHRAVAADLATASASALQKPGGRSTSWHSAGTAIKPTPWSPRRRRGGLSTVFVASGLSPRYDLSAALHRTQAGILSVESYFDVFFLGIGTTLLGSADRHWGPAAGMVGFRQPSDASVAHKLHRSVWSPRFVRQGWVGGHISIAAPGFVRGTLAPWVRQAEESETSGNGLRANTHSSTG